MKSATAILLAGAVTFVLVWCVAQIAMKTTGVPDSFPPFTTLPLLSGVVGGFLGAFAVYALVRVSTANPNRVFFFVAIGFLALSFGLPLRLSFTHSPRFKGVTSAAQMTLALLHTLVATSAVAVLTR